MKQIYLKISDAKETPYARKLRIAETENGRKLRCRVVQSKKKYKRSREIPDFNFLYDKCYKTLAFAVWKCYICGKLNPVHVTTGLKTLNTEGTAQYKQRV